VKNISIQDKLILRLTTAPLKWRLGTWDIQELQPLAASSYMKTAPTAGKSWQPSHEPPHSKRNRHPSHCWNGGKREGKGWEGNCLGNELPHYKKTPGNTFCTYITLRSTSTWNSDTCSCVSTPLTTRGTQALFVVNSVKLHLTAFNFYSWVSVNQLLKNPVQVLTSGFLLYCTTHG